MPTTQATVTTDNASVNLKKLCRHFSHKLDTTFDDRRGEIRFPFGTVTLTASDENLSLHGRTDDEAALDRLEQVVGDHLQRFAHKESLNVAWRRDSENTNHEGA